MAAVTPIRKALATQADLEPIGFEERHTVAAMGAAFLGRTVFVGPLTPEQSRRVDVEEAAAAAEQAQQSVVRRQENERRAEAERKARRRDSLTACGISIGDDELPLLVSGELQQTPALSRVRAWLDDKEAKPWLVISGSTGRGKTIAGFDAIAAWGGTFVRAREMARAFTARFGDDQDFQQHCYRVRLLVVDDLGRESDHAAMIGYLEDLLDERPSRAKRTILTTNLDAKQFADTYMQSERLRSRLHKLAEFFGDKGEDMRRRKA